MCNYDMYWSKCTNKVVDNNSGMCEEHSKKVCVICGNQAVIECSGTQLGLICGYSICDNESCKEEHFLNSHSNNLLYFIDINYRKNKGNVKVLFAKIKFDNSVINKIYNNKYVQILLWEYDGKYKLFGNNFLLDSKEEVLKFNKEMFDLQYCDTYISDKVYNLPNDTLYKLSEFTLLRKSPKDINEIFKAVCK